jgi:hypothetical protein
VNPIQDLGLRTVSLIAHLGRLTAFVAQIARNTVRPPWLRGSRETPVTAIRRWSRNSAAAALIFGIAHLLSFG